MINKKNLHYEDQMVRFKISAMKVSYLYKYILTHDIVDLGNAVFEEELEEILQFGPVAARIIMCPSYNNRNGKTIYNPSYREIAKSKGGHMMLLTGFGVDEDGTPKLSFGSSKTHMAKVGEKK